MISCSNCGSVRLPPEPDLHRESKSVLIRLQCNIYINLTFLIQFKILIERHPRSTIVCLIIDQIFRAFFCSHKSDFSAATIQITLTLGVGSNRPIGWDPKDHYSSRNKSRCKIKAAAAPKSTWFLFLEFILTSLFAAGYIAFTTRFIFSNRFKNPFFTSLIYRIFSLNS